MDVPGIVQGELDGEEVAASVSLGGEDALFVTASRTLVYRSESLLSDESVESYPHDAERVTVKDGRRKTRITLTYSIDGERDFTVPSSVADDVLHPVLAGVLNGSGVTDPGETVVQTFRFSELTLIVTSDRLLKHVGSAVWDDDHEQYHFDDVTALDFEEGSVATQIVIAVDGRPQRIKTPNEHIAVVRERLTQALFAYYDVGSLAELNALVDPEEETPDAAGESASAGGGVDFGEGVDPLGSGSGSRPADTSGDPFLDDEKAESLDADARASEPAVAAEDPRRPVSAGEDSGADASADADAGRRRAEPADGAADSRRAEPATDSADSEPADTRRSEPATDSADSEPADSRRAEPAPDSADVTGDATAGGVEESSSLLSPEGATDETEEDAAGGDGSEDGEGGFAAAGFEPATESGVTAADLADRIDDLESRVDAQNDLLEQQQALIQQLIEELRERS
ncbi:DUF7115 domain-containing protein [Halorubellus salinus]|uniref:DUF7115 domain-containing protein n=1 Tax=Halorubellus salinus TaxID=755309 RepID=UPI001D0658B8|nr:hypothetical protein [Halorubellus salinus]